MQSPWHATTRFPYGSRRVEGYVAGRRDLRPCTETSTLRFYRVNDGDTLTGIAKRLYGDESFWLVLYDANEELIRGAGGLRFGQSLYAPFL